MKYYTGIGSRETPIDIQNLMSDIAKSLAKLDYILRSGGADGADSAFDLGSNPAEIYLPWNGFNGHYSDSKRYIVPLFNWDYVEQYHPRADYLSQGAQKLMSRNTYQILGLDLKTTSDFIVCWTSDGKASGGTGQALRIALDLRIPIYNLYNDNERNKIMDDVEKWKFSI